MRRIDLRDLALLGDLYEGSHSSKITGLPIKGFKLDRAYGSIYKRLTLLESYGYVCRGFQVAQADTYFITPDGVHYYEEAMN